MGFIRKLLSFWRKEEEAAEEVVQEEKKTFFQYITCVPRILTWYRREQGIAKKNLELVLIDDEEQPAWEVQRAMERLITDLNLLYIVTGRTQAFEEFAENACEEQGLLVVFLEDAEELPGNLVLDFRDWEKHLDIISEVSYNTMIM